MSVAVAVVTRHIVGSMYCGLRYGHVDSIGKVAGRVRKKGPKYVGENGKKEQKCEFQRGA